jgi:hypothetical protein
VSLVGLLLVAMPLVALSRCRGSLFVSLISLNLHIILGAQCEDHYGGAT